MAWLDSRSPDYATIRGSMGSPGAPGWEQRQSLMYLGGPRDKLQASEAEKDRQLKLQMQQVSMEPTRIRQQWIERLFPQLMGQMGGQGQMVGGTTAPQPDFNPSPIYTDQQMQQQVNAARSQNDARTATQQRLLTDSTAARGFGGQSPAVMALSRQLGMQNMAANATAAREIPFQAAQANADSMFRGQQLQQQRWQSAEDVDIRRRQMQFNQFQSMLSLLGG